MIEQLKHYGFNEVEAKIGLDKLERESFIARSPEGYYKLSWGSR